MKQRGQKSRHTPPDEKKDATNPPSFDSRTTWVGRQSLKGDKGLREIHSALEHLYALPIHQALLTMKGAERAGPQSSMGERIRQAVERPEFFARWHGSGLRLRHWLLKEVTFAQDLKMSAHSVIPPPVLAAFDRACVRRVVADAIGQMRSRQGERLVSDFLRSLHSEPRASDADSPFASNALRRLRRNARALIRGWLIREGCIHDAEIEADLEQLLERFMKRRLEPKQ